MRGLLYLVSVFFGMYWLGKNVCIRLGVGVSRSSELLKLFVCEFLNWFVRKYSPVIMV